MNVFKLLLVVGLMGSAFLVGWFVRETSLTKRVEPLSAPVGAALRQPSVKAQGTLVPRSGLVSVFGPPNQVIESIPVSPGQPIVKGETELATFALTRNLRRQAELAAAQSEDLKLEMAQRVLLAEGEVEAARLAVSLAELQFEQAQVRDLLEIPEQQLATAKAKLARLEALAADPKTESFIATTAIEEQHLAIKEAEIQLRYAGQRHESAQQAAKLELEAANEAHQRAAAAHQALVQMQQNPVSAQLAVSAAEAAAKEGRLLAPLDGVVVQVLAQVGDVASHTPLMQVADLNHMDCIAEVPDRMIAQIELGDPVEIESQALPNPLAGKVVEISPVVGSSRLPNPNPMALIDRKTVEVRIEINGAHVATAAKLIQLQVTATFSKKK